MNTLGNTLIDNSEKLKLVDTLDEIISMQEISEICIATGYWDLKGTALVADSLLKFLERDGTKMRLLIGKDPNVFRHDLTNESYESAKKYPQDYLKIDLQNVEMNNGQYQRAAKMLMDYCEGENPKIEVHIFDLNENDERQFLHSKCYIFYNKIEEISYGIIGSSNFTQKGLEGNAELNYLESSWNFVGAEGSEKHKTHLRWFNEKWALSKDWTKEFVIEIGNSPVGKKAKGEQKSRQDSDGDCPYTILNPKETYIKFLIDQFDEIINFNGKKNRKITCRMTRTSSSLHTKRKPSIRGLRF